MVSNITLYRDTLEVGSYSFHDFFIFFTFGVRSLTVHRELRKNIDVELIWFWTPKS